MPKLEPETPKRPPTQERSRALVRAIQEACLRILTEEGPEALSTNRIAERAGVGVASLYRYFPNKEAIVAQVFEEKLAEESEALRAHAERPDDFTSMSLSEVVRFLVDENAERNLRLLAFHEDFYQRYHFKFALADRIRDTESGTWLELADGWIADVLRREGAAVPDPERAAFLMARSLLGVMHATVRERPELLSDPAFREELARALLAPLAGG